MLGIPDALTALGIPNVEFVPLPSHAALDVEEETIEPIAKTTGDRPDRCDLRVKDEVRIEKAFVLAVGTGPRPLDVDTDDKSARELVVAAALHAHHEAVDVVLASD